MYLNRNIIVLLVILSACGGQLSEKERKALHDEMELREIKQIRDEDIVNKALEIGRSLKNDKAGTDSLRVVRQVYTQIPEEPVLAELWEAYYDALLQNLDPGDNVQRDYPESLLYTYAEIQADSTFQMVVYKIPKKTVVLSLQAE